MSEIAGAPELPPGGSRSEQLDEVVAGIGERVRALRLRSGLTLQDLADRTGLSLSMLSTVERGRANASLATLNAIASALGVQITTLFTRSGGEDTPVIPAADQLRDVTDGGMVRRTAVYRSDLDVEIYVDEYEPHTAQQRRPSQHPGHEFGVVIEGELELQLDGEIFTVSTGDVAQFSGKHAHLIRNATDAPARAVWVNLRRL